MTGIFIDVHLIDSATASRTVFNDPKEYADPDAVFGAWWIGEILYAHETMTRRVEKIVERGSNRIIYQEKE